MRHDVIRRRRPPLDNHIITGLTLWGRSAPKQLDIYIIALPWHLRDSIWTCASKSVPLFTVMIYSRIPWDAYIAETQITTTYDIASDARPNSRHVNFDRKTCHNKFTFIQWNCCCSRSNWSFWGQTIHRSDWADTPAKPLNNYGENVCSQTSTTSQIRLRRNEQSLWIRT